MPPELLNPARASSPPARLRPSACRVGVPAGRQQRQYDGNDTARLRSDASGSVRRETPRRPAPAPPPGPILWAPPPPKPRSSLPPDGSPIRCVPCRLRLPSVMACSCARSRKTPPTSSCVMAPHRSRSPKFDATCVARCGSSAVNVERFDLLLREAYEAGSGTTMDAMGGLEEETDLANLAQDIPEQSDLLDSEDERLSCASSTRFCPRRSRRSVRHPRRAVENRLVIRFRVDGILRDAAAQARGGAADRLAHQGDGPPGHRREALAAGRPLSLRSRVARSTCASDRPAGHGERVVLRLLDKQAGRLDLNALGMGPRDADIRSTS